MAHEEEDDLVIDYGTGKAAVEINSSQTLADVRSLMMEEFDEDMFPGSDWCFWVDGTQRITLKQEGKKVAWTYLKRNKSISIRSTNSNTSTPTARCAIEANASDPPASKRARKTVPARESSPPPAEATSLPSDQKWSGSEGEGPARLGANTCSSNGSANFDTTGERESHLTKGGWPKKKSKEPTWAKEAAQEIIDVNVDIMDDDSDGEEDVDDSFNAQPAEITPTLQPGLAFQMTKANLRVLKAILDDKDRNQKTLSEARLNECSRQVKKMLERSRPQTIIGVYGSTGVGKSSLLNALLDESSVLPTSGSRGCTAAVVELVFNSDLVLPREGDVSQQVSVYRGEVEFMTKKDWDDELRILVRECSTDMGRLYTAKPYEKTQPAAAAAWAKINQVYGGGTLEKCYDLKTKKTTTTNEETGSREDSESEGDTLAAADAPPEMKVTWTTERVFNYLSNNRRVTELLTPTSPNATCNVIEVSEGLVEPASEEAKSLIKPFAESEESERMLKEHWASAFREKIDAFVYKTGKEKDAQTWPLIRKVRLLGPWHVLSTGACLVDLPGVKDANAARAKVAEAYLEHCSNIWIVAPIKRAVDDGTAKELMGEQFKRRLLMDDQYGNISFICTSTDKVEASETMRDHEDIAKQTPGRWEKMMELVEESKRLGNKERERASLEHTLLAANRSLKTARKAMMACKDKGQADNLKFALQKAQEEKLSAESKIVEFKAEVKLAQRRSKNLQNQLKVLCAKIRNEYSKGRLQDDFKNGLREMYLKGADEASLGEVPDDKLALPDSFLMDVFCTSANDYMKATGVKSRCDGPPETFFDPSDTQIPLLRRYVHETTNNHCKQFVRDFVESAEHLVKKVELFASGAKYVASREETAVALKGIFNSELEKIEPDVIEISETFKRLMEGSIATNLTPALSQGAEKSKVAAMTTVKSWGQAPYRTKTERGPERNGLCWSTYQAAVRRNGQYTSKSVGLVDMNQELYDPMEKAFATDWQRTMGLITKTLLSGAKAKVESKANILVGKLTSAFLQAGLEQSSLDPLMAAASRAVGTAVNAAFDRMERASTKLQRQLTRSMLPKIKKKMMSSYNAAANVECGSGKFERMKTALYQTSQPVLSNMFTGTLQNMHDEIAKAVKSITNSILKTFVLLGERLESFLSLSWDLDRARASSANDGLLRELGSLLKAQKEAAVLLGMDEGTSETGSQDESTVLLGASAESDRKELPTSHGTTGGEAIADKTTHQETEVICID